MMKKTIAILDTTQNRLIVAVFLSSFVLFVLSYHMEVGAAYQLLATVITLTGVNVTHYIIDKKEKTERNIDGTNETKAFLISRKSQCEKLKNHSTITILTGESGSGKSVLIWQLCEALNQAECREAVIVINDDYYRNVNVDDLRKYEYVVFDQFENALKWDNIQRQRDEIIKLKNRGVRVLIVVRKEYLGDVYHLLNGKARIVYLTNEDIKEDQVAGLLQEMVQESYESVREEGFTAQIIKDFEAGDLTFIQLHALAALLSDDGFELVDGEHDYNQVIKRFIRYKIDKIYDADAAREILYLLSLGYYGKEQHFNLKDFRNITIMREDSLERIVEWLVSNEWICESDKTPYKDKNTSRKFVITHDYYRDLLWEICIEDIDPEVRSNIDQYNIIYQQGALSPSAKMSATDEIYDRSREYICSERNLLKFVLYLFLGLLFVGNALNLHSFDFNHSIYAWEQALLQVVLMLSTIYVYNLYYHFLLSKYKVGLVAGFLLCLLCLWRASYWGIWLGLEVMIMGGIMLHIHLRYMREKTEDRFFLARAANFLSLGTVIVLLGYTYQAVIRGQLQFMFLFFSLYAIFICLTIRAHIHREYMLKLVGKAVYNT